MRTFSILDVQTVAPDDFRRWAVGGTSLAVLGYTAVAGIGWWQQAKGTVPVYTTASAAVACAVAVAIAVRGRPRLGVILAITVFILEVHVAMAVAPGFPSPSLVAAPLIVIATTLLFGPRTALVVALLTIVATAPLYALAPAGVTALLSRAGIYWLGVHATATLAAWALMALTMSALSRTVEIAQQREREVGELIAFAPDGILILDEADRVLTANPAADRLLGVDEGRSAGRQLEDVLTMAGGGDTAVALRRFRVARATCS